MRYLHTMVRVTDLDAFYRREVGRCTATLIRVLGDVDAAEDAVAEAFAEALQRRRTVRDFAPTPCRAR